MFGYYFLNSQRKASFTTPPELSTDYLPSPKSEPSSDESAHKEWSTLKYSEYGLSFKIPAGWGGEEHRVNIDGFPQIDLGDQKADPFLGGYLQLIIKDNPGQLSAKEYVETVHIPEIKRIIDQNNYDEAGIMIFNFENSRISPFKVARGDAVKLDGSFHVAIAGSYPVYFVSSDKRIIEIIGKPYTTSEGNEPDGKVEIEGEEIISTIELD